MGKKSRDALNKFHLYSMGSVVALILLLFISINAGFIEIPLHEIWKVFVGKGTDATVLTILQFRLPRIVIALLIGAGISTSGAIIQGVVRNPLADPGILGINAGASLAVVLYMFFLQGTVFFNTTQAIFILPLTALIGSFTVAILIYMLAMKKGFVTTTRLLLIGIGMNAACNAAIIVFQMKMEPADFTQALVWLSGSIWATNWQYVLAIVPWIVILLPIVWWKSRELDLLALGEATATGLGVDVEKERRQLLTIAVALAGVCVAVGGSMTFLGLIIPHIVRKLIGTNHRYIIPLSALLGALFLLGADTLGRILFAPAELPVGLIISMIGAPYFIYLLLKSNE